MDRDWEKLTEVIDAARNQAEKLSLSERTLYILCLVLEEILANAIMHAGEHLQEGVLVSLHADTDKVSIEFTDHGTAFDPTSAPPMPPAAPQQQGGFGLHLVNTMATSVSYERRNEANILTVTIDNTPEAD